MREKEKWTDRDRQTALILCVLFLLLLFAFVSYGFQSVLFNRIIRISTFSFQRREYIENFPRNTNIDDAKMSQREERKKMKWRDLTNEMSTLCTMHTVKVYYKQMPSDKQYHTAREKEWEATPIYFHKISQHRWY